MSTTTIYGIKNCDTMKKALKWLDENGVDYVFHDYKKQGLDDAAFILALNEHSWETVINRRGTTWRNLPDDVKTSMNNARALPLAQENPSVVKRPLLLHKGQTYLGFKAESYAKIFS